MEITGKLIEILEAVSGEGKNGPWKKQEFIIETPGEYHRKVCIASWNDKVDLSNYKIGDEISAQVNIESREFNQRWYTDIKIWKLDVVDQGNEPSHDIDNDKNREIPPDTESDSGTDDLPF